MLESGSVILAFARFQRTFNPVGEFVNGDLEKQLRMGNVHHSDPRPEKLREFENSDDITRSISTSQASTIKLNDSRLYLPQQQPHIEELNVWNSNLPETTLFMPG